jgi:hypothetical protein
MPNLVVGFFIGQGEERARPANIMFFFPFTTDF